MADPSRPLPRAYFRRRPLDNLSLADEIESLNPILDSMVMNLLPNSDTPQIFTINGRGARSTFRTLRHGLEVDETVSSDLPGIPNVVWTVKLTEDGGQLFFVLTGPLIYLCPLQTSMIPISSCLSSTVPLFYLSGKTSKRCKILVSCRRPQLSLFSRLAEMHYFKFIHMGSGTFFLTRG